MKKIIDERRAYIQKKKVLEQRPRSDKLVIEDHQPEERTI